jgi:hypothetical protein
LCNTSAIGNAAISYYIDGKTIEEAIKKFEKSKKVNAGSSVN